VQPIFLEGLVAKEQKSVEDVLSALGLSPYKIKKSLKESGYCIVPVRPTENMIEAGWRDGMSSFGEGEESEPVYLAMIAAFLDESHA
jgi:hypothetical protein